MCVLMEFLCVWILESDFSRFGNYLLLEKIFLVA